MLILAEFVRIQLSWQNLAELGRTYLLSVSLRHSYCNWASPVTQCSTIRWKVNKGKRGIEVNKVNIHAANLI